MKKKKSNWPWWVILLWSYTTLVSILIGATSILIPNWVNSAPPASSTETTITGIVIYLPQIIFLIFIGIKNFKN